HVGGRFIGGDLRGVLERLRREVVGAVPGEVGVVVEEAGHNCLARGLGDRSAVAARSQVGAATNTGDLAVLNPDEPVLDQATALTGPYAPGEHEPAVARPPIWHALHLLELPSSCFRHR